MSWALILKLMWGGNVFVCVRACVCLCVCLHVCVCVCVCVYVLGVDLVLCVFTSSDQMLVPDEHMQAEAPRKCGCAGSVFPEAPASCRDYCRSDRGSVTLNWPPLSHHDLNAALLGTVALNRLTKYKHRGPLFHCLSTRVKLFKLDTAK